MSSNILSKPITLYGFSYYTKSDQEFRSSGVGVGSEVGLDITRGRKDDAASAYVLRPL